MQTDKRGGPGIGFMNRVVVIGGPTGVGKSELAFHLAAALDGELVSCDSVQVFRGLHIGANKTPVGTPRREHLLDLVDWRDDFTAAEFHVECVAKLREIMERGRVPILVGGTGFYLDWVLRGRPTAPPTDPAALAAVSAEVAADGGDWQRSWMRLQAVDPEYATVLLPNDYYRLKRALAVHRATGQPLSHFKTRRCPQLDGRDLDFRCFFLTADREYVCRNIDWRCEEMVERGLLEEVAALRRAGMNADCQAGRSIGYHETLRMFDQLEGREVSASEGREVSASEGREVSASEGSEVSASEGSEVSALRARATLNTPETTLNTQTRFILSTLPRLKKVFFKYLDEFKSATRQYSRRQENWFARMNEFRWVERVTPFDPIDPVTSPLFRHVLDAVMMERAEFDSLEGPVAMEDVRARSLVTDVVRRRMKTYVSVSSRFVGSKLEDILRRLVNLL